MRVRTYRSSKVLFWSILFFVLNTTIYSHEHHDSSSLSHFSRGERVNPVVLSKVEEEQLELLLQGQLNLEEIENERIWEYLFGGDIIGNGGGLVESFFRFSYQNLYKYINEYLITYKNQIATEDYINLATVANIRNLSEQRDYALIFLSGEEELFSNAEIPHRLAVTAYHPGAPVLINRSQLYDTQTGEPLLNQADTVAILVHELGHQAGIENHAYLDKLGNMVKAFIEDQSERIKIKLNGHDIIFTIKNPIADSILFESQVITQERVYDIREQIQEQISCPSGSSLKTLNLWNLHWLRAQSPNSIKVGLWVDFYCYEKASESLYAQSAEVKVDVSFKD